MISTMFLFFAAAQPPNKPPPYYTPPPPPNYLPQPRNYPYLQPQLVPNQPPQPGRYQPPVQPPPNPQLPLLPPGAYPPPQPDNVPCAQPPPRPLQAPALKRAIDQEKAAREQNFWPLYYQRLRGATPLFRNLPSLAAGPSQVVYRTSSHPDENGNWRHTPIFYHVYAPPGQEIKGAVVYVYGSAGTSMPFIDHAQGGGHIESILAQNGYLVYTLILRGAPGFDHLYPRFSVAQQNAEGIKSLVRDVALFGAILKGKIAREANTPPLKWSELLTPDKALFLMGSSFGGYLTLMTATDTQDPMGMTDHPYRYHSVYFDPKMIFDGFISHAGVSSQQRDLLSGTTSGLARVGPAAPGSWIQQYLAGTTPDDPTITPFVRTRFLKRPLFLSHAMNDDNVSAIQSLSFHAAATKAQKGQLIAQHYFMGDHLIVHWDPRVPMYDHDNIESILSFMDAVRFSKQMAPGDYAETSAQGPNLFDWNEGRKIRHAAWFLTRVIHPTIFYPHYIYMKRAIEAFYAGNYGAQPFNDNTDYGVLTPIECHQGILFLSKVKQVLGGIDNLELAAVDRKLALKALYFLALQSQEPINPIDDHEFRRYLSKEIYNILTTPYSDTPCQSRTMEDRYPSIRELVIKARMTDFLTNVLR